MFPDYAQGFAPPRAMEHTFLASVAFVALLLLVFVGFTPFLPPVSAAPLAAASAAEGDLQHQIFYLAIFAVTLIGAAQRRGLGALRAVPLLLLVLELWCLASAYWAPEHGLALRRATLQAMLTVAVLLCADTIGPERAFKYWRVVLALILLVNWISIPLIATARHLPGEIDPSLVGDWRGLYAQKNSAGAVCAMTVMLFLFSRNGRHNWIGWLVSLAALGFLVMTRSKTSLALLPVALAAGWCYRQAWRDGLGRAIFLCAAILLLVLAGGAAIAYSDQIYHLLQDPAEFTGRAEIWQSYIAYVADHPWLGAGFGMLSNNGGLSPMHGYARSAWVEAIGDSHNGYLQLVVTIGGVGFVLAILALIVQPLAQFWPLDYHHPRFKALLFAFFVFFVAHNFMESDFLQGDSSAWFAILMVVAALRHPDKSLTPLA